ncbi:MAG: copper chaperone CopZ [Bacillota bacterium]
MTTSVLNVEGMSCAHCKKAVENALKTLDGVDGAEVNLDKGTVTIEHDNNVVSAEGLKKTIREAGYEVK